MWKKSSLHSSFNYAIEGVINTLKTERNMKIHLLATIVVVLLSLAYEISKVEFVALSISITLVWCTELINTAIESSIDLVCKEYRPLAKKAKDAAAGAVLVTAINACVIGYLIFKDKLQGELRFSFYLLKASYQDLWIIITSTIIVGIVLIKSYYNRGTPLKGGMPSGHSALAVSLWVLLVYITRDIKVFFIGMILALLVIQSRIEGKIHSLLETFIGALLGGAITYIMLVVFDV